MKRRKCCKKFQNTYAEVFTNSPLSFPPKIGMHDSPLHVEMAVASSTEELRYRDAVYKFINASNFSQCCFTPSFAILRRAQDNNGVINSSMLLTGSIFHEFLN